MRSGKLTPPPARASRDGAMNARSRSRFTVDKDLGHRRLKVGHLTTLISHRTVRFSPHPGSGIARGAHGKAPDRRCQNTFAHPPAALLMPHSMCDMPHLRPGLLARSVMHRAQPCRRLAHHIHCKPPLNEARELGSRLSPRWRPGMTPASAVRAQEASSRDIQRSSDVHASRAHGKFRFSPCSAGVYTRDSPLAPRPGTQPLALSRALTGAGTVRRLRDDAQRALVRAHEAAAARRRGRVGEV